VASAKSKDCLVGFELLGDRLRLAAFTGTNSAARATVPRRLHCEEIVIPGAEACSPASLPPASSLVPLLKATLGRLGISGGQAAVAVAGRRMVLRYSVGSDGLVGTDLQQAIDRSVSYVQFGVGDRVVGEHLHRLADGRTHALLGVSAAATIDPLAKALEQVGLRVTVIEPALVALARMASVTGQLNSKVALLVLADADGIEIGAVSDGHVLVSRRPLLAGGLDSDSPAPERASRLPGELERMSRHYLRTFGTSEEVHDIILCGPADLVRPYAQALENSQDFQADLLRINDAVSTALAVPSDDLAAKEAHVVALGAVAGLVHAGSNVVGPNLTAEPEVRRRPALEGLLRSLLWPTLAAIGIWAMAYFGQGRLESTLTMLRIEAEQPSPVELEYRELQLRMTQTEQRAARLSEFVQKFQERNWKGLLETIRICVPDRLWLSHVRLTAERQLTIGGAAYDESLVYQFRRDLEGAPLFASATIVTTTSTERGNTIVTEFSLECTLIASLPAPEKSNP